MKTRALSTVLIGIALCSLVLGIIVYPVFASAANPVLSKTMIPARPKIGEPAWIKIVATNLGPENADNVVITDPIPDNMALAGVSTTQGSVNVHHGVVTIYVGTIAPGQTVTVTNDVIVTREFANDIPYTNCTGLTFRDGTARLSCFPLGPAFTPVSVTTPPSFLPEAGASAPVFSMAALIVGTVCLLIAHVLRRR